jgi:predicted  nucleic acid-binding Zn-ribbon protein
MSDNELECNYCGVVFDVSFEEEDETVKYCPACGESMTDYILDEDSFNSEGVDEWYKDTSGE